MDKHQIGKPQLFFFARDPTNDEDSSGFCVCWHGIEAQENGEDGAEFGMEQVLFDPLLSGTSLRLLLPWHKLGLKRGSNQVKEGSNYKERSSCKALIQSSSSPFSSENHLKRKSQTSKVPFPAFENAMKVGQISRFFKVHLHCEVKLNFPWINSIFDRNFFVFAFNL